MLCHLKKVAPSGVGDASPRPSGAPLSPWVALSLSCVAALIPLGCASAGQPRPPSLHLPGLAQKLVAARVGDEVKLSWTTPSTTTDGESIRGPVVASVCLDIPSGAAAKAVPRAKRGKRPEISPSSEAPCNVVATTPASPGPVATSVPLPASLRVGSPTAVAVRVELANGNGRSAGPSAPALVPAGAAPAAVDSLRISARREGAQVQWKPVDGTAVVELKRTVVDLPATIAPARTSAASAPPPRFLPRAANSSVREVALRPDTSSTADPGGVIDRTVQDGGSYLYVAQRVETVTLAGQTLELRSAPSSPVAFAFHDIFPPRAPTGLLLVPGGAFGQPPSLDLSWDPNPESDVLGYNIYRAEGGSEFVRRNAEPVPESAFRDLEVQPGHTYLYRITALDRRRNESAPGTPVPGTP